MTQPDLFGETPKPKKRSTVKRDTVKALKASLVAFTNKTPGLNWMAIGKRECRKLIRDAGYTLTYDEKTSVAMLLAGYCSYLDDRGMISYGATELEALQNLEQAMNKRNPERN